MTPLTRPSSIASPSSFSVSNRDRPILCAMRSIFVRQWRHERVVVEFANWARSQRRIKMDLMAQRIGRSRFETEKLLGEAIDDGLVKGVIDRSADEFVAQDGDEGRAHFVGVCPNCGGNVDAWYFPEERVTCPYCERTVAVPAVSVKT